MLAKITLLGFHEYDADTLWANFSLPEGLDTDLCKSVIIERCGELPLRKPDLNYLSWRIGVFSKHYKWTIEKWIELINAEYDPLINYDRKESWSDTGEIEGTSVNEGSTSARSSGGSNGSGTETHKVSGYNESTFQNATQDTTEDSITTTNTTTGTSSNEGSTTSNSESTHEGRVYGNIGVTTTQKMWLEQAELVQFNIYNRIAEIFTREFCIGVYV